MKNYKVFKHPDGRIEAVKQGWSWPGFLFGFIWALVKKLWAVAGILIAFGIVVGVISVMLEPDPYSYGNYYEYNSALKSLQIWDLVSNLIGLAVAIFLGIKGNSLRENNLLGKGYELIGTVIAANPDMAVAEVKKSEGGRNNYSYVIVVFLPNIRKTPPSRGVFLPFKINLFRVLGVSPANPPLIPSSSAIVLVKQPLFFILKNA